ncbi:MAG: V-type ATPase 116kDa subunit family protein, partial [Nitrososphaerota archaeon]
LNQLFKGRRLPTHQVTVDEELALLSGVEALLAEIEREVREGVVRFRMLREFILELRNLQLDLGELRYKGQFLLRIVKMPLGGLRSLEYKLETRVRYATVYTADHGRGRFAVVVYLAALEEEVLRIFREENVEEARLPEGFSGTPVRCLRMLNQRENEVRRKYEMQILHLHDAILSKLARVSAMRKLGKAGRIYVLEGWVPAHLAERACSIVEEASGGFATVQVDPPDEPEGNIPTLLPDRPLLGCFRFLVEMYDTPAYNEIDPTPFLAFLFILFFGLMSADIAVGLTMMLGAYLIIRGAGTRSENMRDLGATLLVSSVSSTIFGLLGGEFMGGLLHLPVFWMSSVEKPIDFMFVAILIGVATITLGIALGIHNSLSTKQYKRLVGEQLSALSLIAGAGIIFLTGNYTFTGLSLFGYTLIFAGLGMLLAVQKLIGLLQITTLLSNIISFVRIMAINISSGWMLRTFILIGEMVGSVDVFGPILMAVILTISHLFIVFIFSFSTFAHSLRLIYVEFFNRFFVGGGRKFTPISSDREFTSIKT